MSLIYAGRLDELKGIKTLFEAWRIMGADAPRLTVCGNGQLEEWCQRSAEDLNIDMLGYVDAASLREKIAQSRALILPTLLYEGFPMTVAEAFSVGTPVICSDIGNAGNLIQEGVTGWKFSPGNAEELVDAVQRCMNSGDLRDAVKQEYENKYTPEANYRILSDIYARVQASCTAFGNRRG